LETVAVFLFQRIAVAGVAAGLLAAASPGPTAILRLKAVERSWFRPNSNSFAAFDNDHCQAGRRRAALGGALFGTDFGRKVQPASVPAGQRLYLRATSEIVHWDQGGMTGGSCTNLVSFIPQDGHTYDVAQSNVDRQCATSITDAATGEAPSTFQSEPLRWTCMPG
jgi:hypothetical protein